MDLEEVLRGPGACAAHPGSWPRCLMELEEDLGVPDLVPPPRGGAEGG